METAPLLSVVVPVLNESANLPELHRRLSEVVAGLKHDDLDAAVARPLREPGACSLAAAGPWVDEEHRPLRPTCLRRRAHPVDLVKRVTVVPSGGL